MEHLWAAPKCSPVFTFGFPMKMVFLATACIAAAAGCASKTPGSSSSRVCPVHHTAVRKLSGYAAARFGCPSWDYLRFVIIKDPWRRYPFKTPDNFFVQKTRESPIKVTAKICDQCDASFEQDLTDYRKLPERTKERLASESLGKVARKFAEPSAAH